MKSFITVALIGLTTAELMQIQSQAGEIRGLERRGRFSWVDDIFKVGDDVVKGAGGKIDDVITIRPPKTGPKPGTTPPKAPPKPETPAPPQGPKPNDGVGPKPDDGVGPKPDDGVGSAKPKSDDGVGSTKPKPNDGAGPKPDDGVGSTKPKPDDGVGSTKPKPDDDLGSTKPKPDDGVGPKPDDGVGPKPDDGVGPKPGFNKAEVKVEKPASKPKGVDEDVDLPPAKSKLDEVETNPSQLVDAPAAKTWGEKAKNLGVGILKAAQFELALFGLFTLGGQLFTYIKNSKGEKEQVEVDPATGLPLGNDGRGYENTSQFYYYGRPLRITDSNSGIVYDLDTESGYYYFTEPSTGEVLWYYG